MLALKTHVWKLVSNHGDRVVSWLGKLTKLNLIARLALVAVFENLLPPEGGGV